MQPGHYGSTLEIDHIVSLELGGSNDIANLYPEKLDAAPGYQVKDRLENKAARPGLRRSDDPSCRTAWNRDELAGALQARLRHPVGDSGGRVRTCNPRKR